MDVPLKYVSTWDIPKDGKKSTWQRAFLLDVLAKLPLCAIVGNEFRVPHANYRLINKTQQQVVVRRCTGEALCSTDCFVVEKSTTGAWCLVALWHRAVLE